MRLCTIWSNWTTCTKSIWHWTFTYRTWFNFYVICCTQMWWKNIGIIISQCCQLCWCQSKCQRFYDYWDNFGRSFYLNSTENWCTSGYHGKTKCWWNSNSDDLRYQNFQYRWKSNWFRQEQCHVFRKSSLIFDFIILVKTDKMKITVFYIVLVILFNIFLLTLHRILAIFLRPSLSFLYKVGGPDGANG